MPVGLALGDFRDEYAATIVGWVCSAGESSAWASVPFLRLTPDLLTGWHAQPGVVPCVGLLDGRVCAYGQIWEDHADDEAEVARVIVAPGERGRGVGRAFVVLLAAEASRRGFRSVVARVVRGERAGFACYRAAGFVRLALAEEASLNLDQDRDYVWLRLGPDGPRL
jgi:ribosomal-protein-alanine N-acetyltransferase